jgi:hypothetical protein
MLKLATFAILCSLAVLFAACAKEERECALVASATILGNWFLCSMPWIYNPASFAHLAKLAGLQLSHEQTWAAIDLFSMIVICWHCRYQWWSAIMWATYMIMLTMHVVAWQTEMNYDQYETVLDAALVCQLAVIFMLGSDGVADRLLAYWRFHSVRTVGQSSVASHRET